MAFGINGGTHRFTLDELQNATIANSQDNTALTGKGQSHPESDAY